MPEPPAAPDPHDPYLAFRNPIYRRFALSYVLAVISSQIELIKSRDTLLPVVEQLNLDTIPEFNGAGVSPITLLLQRPHGRLVVRSCRKG